MENNIEIFRSEEHYSTLCHWMHRHDLGNPEEDMLSNTGLVVNDTAIGFLFKTNSKTAYIDNIVTNPAKTSQERDVSLAVLITNLGIMAKDSGFKLLTVLSNTSNMDKRLFTLGYKSSGAYSLYYKET